MALMDEAVWRGKIYSGGWAGGSGGDAAVIEPATGAELGRIGIATPADVARAAQLAAAAQPDWAATPHTERSAVLRRAADLWLANAPDIEWWGIRESGKIPPAMAFETHVATTEIYEAATLPSRAYGELLPSEQPRLSFAERVPVGVVGVIAPFNFPQILAIRSVAPALALGNAVILKPDPRTAVSGGVALARVFEEAGLPDGLLHVLPGGADTGEARGHRAAGPAGLLHRLHRRGPPGRRAGRATPQARAPRARRQLRPDRAGRRRPGPRRLGRRLGLVPASGPDLHDHRPASGARGHLRRLRGRAGRQGRPPAGREPGHRAGRARPDHRPRQRDKVHGLVTGSVEAGARLAAGGEYDGLFYRPTVLADVTTQMPAYANEVFGPVAPVIRFATADDAAKLAADSEYGLSLGILTRDVMRGLELAGKIPTGIVHINEQTVDDEPNIPFGGLVASGTGARFGGDANLDAFTETRWVTVRGDIAPYPF